MAKLSLINQNLHKQKLIQKYKNRRNALRQVLDSKETDFDVRIDAMIKLSELPRNGSRTRFRNRCKVSGRPRGFHRKFDMSRIALRELGSLGLIPGLVKSSW